VLEHAVISHDPRLASTARHAIDSRWRAVRRILVAGLAACSACIAPQRPDDVLVIASGADLESANPLVTTHPLSRQVQRYALFVTLLRQDSALAPQPYYARRWSWSPDRRVLTLSLAGDLKWHDGVPTTARDAAFTLLAAKDRATGFPRAAELAGLDTAVAIDDSTLALRFRAPPPSLPPLLAELPIVPAHRLAQVPRATMRGAAFNEDPVGNGPFRFTSRQRGQRWSFGRNDAFPRSLGGPPALRGLVVAVVDEATTKFAGLASGELDMAGISPALAALAQRDRTLRLVTYPVLFGNALFFNTTRPPFDDARVRRAVALSIDRARIVEVAMSGYGRPATSAVPPDSPLGWSAAVQRDTTVADALLDAAGWRRGTDGIRVRAGRPLTVELLSVGSGDNVVEQLLQADLAARGIRLTLRLTEMGSFLTTARAAEKRFDLLLAGVPGDLSLSYLSGMFSSAQRGGTLDYTGYHTPPLDALLAAAAAAPAGEPSRAAWRAVLATLDSLAPATWIYHARGVQGMSRRVHGVRMDLRVELVTLHDWTLAPRGAPAP
jgi:peptide/nickel transport system substrate-binding protein